MRLCWREGEFLLPVYLELRDHMSWTELQRVMTTRAIVGDRDGDYNEWLTKNGERARKQIAKREEASDGPRQLTLEDYMRELDGEKQGLASVREELTAHRAALAHGRGVDEGLLEPGQVDFKQQVEDVHALKVEKLETAITELFGPEAATLPSD